MIRSLIRRTRGWLRGLERWLWPPPDPYTTHLPVLIGLAQLYPVRRVLELGSGRYSTLAFLDKTAFPHLEELVSLETDATWLAEVRELAGADPRVKFEAVTGPMAERVATLDLTGFDLVFVDDSALTADRAATLGAVFRQSPPKGLVVAHDMENEPYRRQVPVELGRHEFAAFVPNTWAIWGGSPPVPPASLAKLAQTLKQHAGRTLPADRAGWLSHLSAVDPTSRHT